MYSVVLSLERHPEVRKIDAAHQYVMRRILAALQNQIAEAAFQGTSDLTWQNRKFSGNSLKIARQHLLYHGTILYRADLDLVDRCLKFAPRQPDYRDGRGHRQFITNVAVDEKQLTRDLVEQFQAKQIDVRGMTLATLHSAIRELRKVRYDSRDWHFRH
jgi:lipoate-protein ligase A